MKKTSEKRNSPLVGYTILPEHKEYLNRLQVFMSVKKGKIISQSEVIRCLIILAMKHEDEVVDIAVPPTNIPRV